ncbi:ARID/BRIGHT DNA-binding domain-containing protein isoform X2 [Wolffia australiana]
MFHAHGLPKQNCTLLAVLCGKIVHEKRNPNYPFPELKSAGRLEVHTIVDPTIDRFREVLKSTDPNIIYFQGERLENEEIGSLVWNGSNMWDPSVICPLITPPFATIVYLDAPNGEKVAEALHSKGTPYVIFWKNTFSSYAASHFRHALFSVVQSSSCHAWDAFQVAHASLQLYCQKLGSKNEPCLLGDAPKIPVIVPDKYKEEEEEEQEEGSSETLPTIKVYDDEIDVGFLVCGFPRTLVSTQFFHDACLLGSMEDGLNALLSVEIRGSKLQNRVSAAPPPLQAGTFSRGVVTMRCDLTTCSSAHISLLVSGSAEACFDDQLLEAHIKNQLIEKNPPVRARTNSDELQASLPDPRKSSSIACGSSAFEVHMKIPSWAAQVLKQLAPQISYRSLVALGVASIQGSSVASFEREDAERLLFFSPKPSLEQSLEVDLIVPSCLPDWFKLPPPCRVRPRSTHHVKFPTSGSRLDLNGGPADLKSTDDGRGRGGFRMMRIRQRPKTLAMRAIPRARRQRVSPLSVQHVMDISEKSQTKPSLPPAPVPKHAGLSPAIPHRRSLTSSFHAQQIISLNPLPLKKHGCGRPPIHSCSEEEFLMDVMQFLILRGHTRLVPQGGISEFPEAILNAKRLDLYNLYREVVSRGGFHVGNGINWKGQVFSKMRNHTLTNKMTGVGNTLKRHYETYLLEYELAHDDVDGECCLLCHSEAGDWVNCGLCGEWAHFGCDKRQGLGAFKDYAKMDGLEYICPHCSLANHKRKSLKSSNGFPQGSSLSRHL